jgi:hypothetical protein
MKFFRNLLLAFSFTTVLALGMTHSASAAWNPFNNDVCRGKASTSAVCLDRNNTANNPLTGPNGLFVKITNLVALAAGIAAIIIIVLSGLRFVTSGGGSEDVAGARRALIYSVVGLVVIVIARTLVVFIIERI